MKADLVQELIRIVQEAPENGMPGLRPFFDPPLVGVASAEDELFQAYKTIIGPGHLTPAEAFALAFPETPRKARSVVSVALPVAGAIRRANRREREWGAREWTLLRSFGDEAFLDHLQAHLARWFQERGARAAAPARLPGFRVGRGPSGPTSNWSERHVAFAAGLGSFGLNDGFITERGMAVRFLSLVTDAELEPDPREAGNITGNCLSAALGTCGACIRRCPVGAISAQGHDKLKCWSHCYGEASKALAGAYGGIPALGNGCGLCQTGVPCEAANPMRERPYTGQPTR